MRIIQKNFIPLSSQLDLYCFLRELYEQNLICVFDFDMLLSKARVERNVLFFMNIDIYSKAAHQYFLSWLKNNHELLYNQLMNTKINPNHEVATTEQVETSREEQNQIRKQFVLLLRRINPNAIAPQMFQDGFLTRDQLEVIFSYPTRKQRSYELCSQLIGRLNNTQILLGVSKSLYNSLNTHQPDLYAEFISKNADAAHTIA